MKVLYCIKSLHNSGGMEKVLTVKTNWLAEHGYEVLIVTERQKGRQPFFSLDGIQRQLCAKAQVSSEYNSARYLYLTLLQRSISSPKVQRRKTLHSRIPFLPRQVLQEIFGTLAPPICPFQDEKAGERPQKLRLSCHSHQVRSAAMVWHYPPAPPNLQSRHSG